MDLNIVQDTRGIAGLGYALTSHPLLKMKNPIKTLIGGLSLKVARWLKHIAGICSKPY